MYEKGPQGLEKKFDNRCASFIQFTLVHPNDVCFRVMLL